MIVDEVVVDCGAADRLGVIDRRNAFGSGDSSSRINDRSRLIVFELSTRGHFTDHMRFCDPNKSELLDLCSASEDPESIDRLNES